MYNIIKVDTVTTERETLDTVESYGEACAIAAIYASSYPEEEGFDIVIEEDV